MKKLTASLAVCLSIAISLFGFSNASAQYCTPYFYYGTHEITNVTLYTMSHSSTTGSYYENNTSATSVPDLDKGATYTINITNANCCGLRSVWIDFNDNGVFNSSNEWVVQNQYTTSTTGAHSLTIPSNAPLGQHRMRVLHNYNYTYYTADNPCANGYPVYMYGQVEDYTINVVTPTLPACALLNYPTNNQSICPTDVSFSWSIDTSGGTPTSYKLYFGTDYPPTNINNGNNIGNVFTYTPTGLSANTTYYWYALPKNSVGSPSNCTIYSFTTNAPCYCTSIAYSYGIHDISNVSIGTLNNSSTTGNYYENHTTITAPQLEQAQSYTLSITNSNYAHNRTVWIDYNNDGTFSTNEQVVSNYYSYAQTSTHTVTIPATATPGIHRMRVVSNYNYWVNASDNSCPNGYPYAYGQVEDYNIEVIVPQQVLCGTLTSPSSNASNICNNTLNLTWAAPTSGGNVQGYYLYLGTDNPPTNLYNGYDLGNITSFSPTGVLGDTVYYWQIVPYNPLGPAIGCAVDSFNTLLCYCSSVSYSYGLHEITNVTLGTLNNSTYSGSYYENNTSVTAPQLEQGISYSMSITNTSYYHNRTVWIDFNDDGIFSVSEQIISNYYSYYPTSSHTITIPSTAPIGQHRMRIVSNYNYWVNSSDNSCPNGYPYAYGQVEDYTVEVIAPLPVVCGSLSSPSNNTTNLCVSSISLSWAAPTSGGSVQGYYLYLGTDNPPTNIYNGYNLGNVTSFTPSNIPGNQTIYWSVVPYNVLGPATNCQVFSFGAVPCYCTPYFYYGVHEITNVSLYTLNSSTSTGSYYEDKSTTVTAPHLDQGASYTISVTSNNSGAFRSVWIDFNDDGTFSNTGEWMVQTQYTSSTTASYTITIPSNAPLGNHRMRVLHNYYYWYWYADNPCANGYPYYMYGQVEDYTIKVVAATIPACANLNTPLNAAAVCYSSVALAWTPDTSGGTPTGYYLYAGTDNPPTNLYNGYNLGNTTSFTITGLTQNATYYWYVLPYNSIGSPSNCTVKTFTTNGPCYCTSVSYSYGVHEITNVTLGTLNNSYSSGSYYENNTTVAAPNLEQGLGYNMTISSNNSSQTRSVWIDFNDDGTFNTTDEWVVQNYYNGSSYSSHTVTIPNNAPVGQHRMRVLQNYYYWQLIADNPCPNGYPYAYGQVEDYTINVIAPQPVVCGTLNSPADNSTNLCSNSLSLTWSAPTSGGNIQGYYLYLGTDNPPTNIYNQYSVGNVLSFTPINVPGNQTIYWSIVPYNALGPATNCQVYSFGAIPCYCTPNFSYGVHEITNVTLYTLNSSTSTGSYYEDKYSSVTAPNLDQGAAYSISITNSSTGGLRSVWIDFNDDGTFNSSNEWLVQNQYTSSNTTTHSMTIPSNATLGNHRMRVLHNYYYWQYTADNPCPNGYPYAYGQVEDFKVNIVAATMPACANLNSPLNAAAVCYSSIAITWSPNTSGGTPSGYNLYVGTDNPPTNLYNAYNVGNTTSFSLSNLTQNVTYYWYALPYNSVGSPANCTINSFVTNGPCYCTSISFAYGLQEITNVTLGTLNNSTQSGSYYENNTTVTAPQLEQGISYPMSITSNSCCQNRTVWIDFNDDGTFATNEQLVSNSYTSSSSASYTITIPATANLGQHRMRIVSNYNYWINASDNPCPNGYPYAYGQVEDYTVQIITPQPVVCGTLTSPANNAVNQCMNSVSLSWAAPTSGGGVQGYYLYLGTDNPPTNLYNGTNVGNVTSYSPTGMVGNQTYYWSIVPYNSLGPAANCAINSFGVIPCYCTPYFYYGVHEITNVTLYTLNSSTTTGSYYEDKYSSVTAPNLDQGATYSISITNNNTGGLRSVWIDFNDDGSFNSSNEWVVQNQYTSSNTASHSMTIPSTATIGNHRMRVLHNYYYWYYTADNPCANGYPTYMYGQVEDFKVNVVAATLPACANLTAPINNASVCYSSLSLGWTPSSAGGSPTGYNLYFGTDNPPTNVYNAYNVGNTTSFSLSGLSQNTTYYWYVVPYNSIGSPSNCTVNSFITNGPCYCTSIVYNNGCYPISNVTLGTLNYSTTSTSYYENNTTVAAPDLEQGLSYTMSVTNGSTSCMSTTMWIDLNDDGTFSSTEALGSINYSCSNPGTFTVSIPSTATLGQHRMRIVTNYAYWQWISDNPCPNGYPYAYGQVEDYTVNITAPQQVLCATLTSPANTANNICNNTLSLSWSAPTSGGSVQGYYLYLGTDFPPTNLYNQYNLGNVTSFTPTGILGDTTYYWSIVPYNPAGPAINCSVNSFNTLLCYCTSISYSYGVHEITNVTLGTLNNSTYSGSYYENNTSVTAPQLEQGINYSMSITNTSYYHNRTVWIDFNDDGTFATNEQIVSNYYSYYPTSSHTISIPSTAPIGQHRMRIVSNYNYWTNSSDNPCPNGYPYAYGQVEDYTIEVIAPLNVVCGTLTSPTSNATNLCMNSINLTWAAPTSGGNVQGYYLYLGTDNPPTNIYNQYNVGNVTSFSPSNILANQTIYWQIVPYNALGPATGCTIDSFGAIPCYCTPYFYYGVHEITNVKLYTMNSSTTTGSYYEDKYSTVTAPNLDQGATYSISITNSNTGGLRSVWIDFNDDGTFNSSNEWVVQNQYTSSNTATHSMTIPSNATLGNHRMRVLHNYYYWYYTADNPCANGYPTYMYGQVEDYKVKIVTPTIPACANLSVPSNAASVCYSSTSLAWSPDTTGGTPTGYNLYVGTDYPPTNLYNGYNVGNTTSFSLSSLTQNATYYWYVVPYNSIGSPSNCTIYSFTTNGPCYCTSISFAYGLQEITNVSIGTMNNSTQSGSYYENNTTVAAPDLEQGWSYTMSITSNSCCQNRTVWIDFNDDGTFASTEQIISNYYSSNSSQSYSVTIPTTANLGQHRMRIVSNYNYWINSSDNPCPNGYPYAYGQVEDYTVNITAPQPAACNTLNSPANNAVNVCNNTLSLSWSAPTTGGNITGYYLYLGTDNPPTNLYNQYNLGNVTSFTPTGILGDTTYYWSIVPYNSLGPATGCSVNTFNTLLCYCTSISYSYGVHEITNVTLGTLNNSTYSGSYYENNTSVTAPQLEQGINYSMSITNTSYYHNRTVWIDFNDDGTFATNEQMVSNYYSYYPTSSHTISIPSTAPLGQHRMRIVSNYNYWTNSSDNPCPSGYPYAYGQVEDYTIEIVVPQQVLCGTISSPSNNASNICANSVSLSWAAPTSGGNVQGYYLYMGTDYPPTNIYNQNNVGNVTSFSPSNIPGNQTIYWQIVPYNALGPATGCTIDSFGTIPCYCTPYFNYGVHEITNVTLYTMNSSTTTGSYYEDKYSTVAAPNLDQGATYSISVTNSSTGGLRSVWIDFNDDGTFNSSDEWVVQNQYTSSNTATHSMSIPSTATLGYHRMRVLHNYYYWYYTADNPCPNGYPIYMYGQVEDYKVKIVTPTIPACANLSVPSNAASVCYSSVSLAWSPDTTGGTPTGYNLYVGTDYPPTNLYNGNNVGNLTSYALSSLTQNATYYWYVVPYNSIGSPSNCTIYSFTTNGPCYCTSISYSYGCYPISNVSIGTLNNSTSSTSYYENNTTVTPPNLEQGWSYTMSVTNGSTSCMSTTMWIDLNDDGTFATSEALGSINYSCSNPGTFTVNIPSTATLGQHRMRIVSNYAYWQWISDNPCPNGYPYAYGQVEDYTVNITAPQPAACNTLNSPANNAVNVCNNTLSLSWSAPTTGGNITGYYLYLGTDNPPTNLYNQYNLGNVTSFTPTGILGDTTYYWSIVPYNSLGPATGCSVNTFNTLLCYCTSISYSYGVHEITNVTLGTLNNSTYSGSYYENNTSVTAPQLEQGINYSMSITNTSYYHNRTVWIDFNDDGTFATNEQMVSNYYSYYPTSSHTISIPSTAPLGQHRMRIVSNYNYWTNSSDNPCPNGYPYAYGQVEDYTIEVITPQPVVCGTLTSPSNNASNICASTVSLSWAAPTSGGNVQGYYLYLGTDNPPTNIYNQYNVGNVTSFSPSNIPGNQTIYWQIVPYNALGPATGCTINSFGAIPCYCTPYFNYGVHEITNVTLYTMNSSTTTGSYYEDKYSTVAAPNLDQGATYSISVTNSSTGGLRSVWIDFNDDGTFNSSNEWVVQNQYTSSNTAMHSMSIPSTATLGYHRMRVLHNYYYWYYTADNPCPNGYPIYMYGQVEDYKVKIVTPTIPACANLSVPSNAASVCYSSVSLAWSPDTTGGTPTGYNLYVGTDYPPTNLYNGNNVGNVTSYALSSLTQNATYYWYVVPYNSIGSPSNCTIYSFTTNGPCYCTSISYSYGCYPISNVSIGTLNNSTSSTSYYENNTTVTPPNLEQGWSYTMSVTNGSTSCMSTTMWIDLNDDGTFATSEALGSINYSCSNPGTFTVNIPSTATLGQHRMRIVSNYAYWQWISDNPCPNGYPYAYGQVEDYTVNITAPQPAACNTLNSPANNAVNVCNNTLSLSWSAPTTGGNITGYYLYLGTDNPPTNLYNQYNLGNVTSFTPTGILGDTTYYWSIVPYNSLGPATGCSVNTFNTLLCYCTSISYSYGVHEITNVTLGTLNNSTYSGSYYENNTSVTAPQLEQGINYSMSITNTSYYHNRTVWIDFNDDGTFATNEQMVSNYYSYYPTSSHTISIPSTAPLGQHRMRIVSNYNYWTNSSDNPCPNGYPYAYGQVEDYTIEVITPQPVVCGTLTSPSNNASNICATSVSLSWAAPTSGGNVQGYYLYMGTDYPPTNIYNQNNVGNVTSFTPSNIPGNQTIYWQIVPYNVLGPATGCTIDSFGAIPCYCTPYFSYGVHEITNVTLYTMNSSTTTGSYYEDKYSTVAAPNLDQSATYSISITNSSTGGLRSVWIDFNDDGTFNSSNEWVVQNQYTNSNTASHSMTIPSTATLGYHRMRVLHNYYYWQYTADNPCPNGYPYAYGQVEDYKVKIVTPTIPACANLSVPSNAAAVCYTSMSLVWSPDTSGGTPTGYNLYVGTDNPPTNLFNAYNVGNTTSFSLSNLTQNVTYYWYVVPYNSIGSPSNCTIYSFTTNGPCYCTSISFAYGLQEITNVTLGTLNNSTQSGSYYENNTTVAAPQLEQGITYSMSITSNSCCQNRTVWIDFNDDGTFATNEQVVSNYYSSNSSQSYSVAIPSTANLGQHRMRIVSNYNYWINASDNPCPNGYPYAYGQVEDYTVEIITPQPVVCGTLTSPSNNASNICANSVSLSWAAPTSGGNVQGYYLYLGTDNPPTNIYNQYNVGNVTSFSPSNIPGNQTIYWQIVPYNALGPATGCTIDSFGAIPCYCTPYFYYGVHEITNVTLYTMNSSTSTSSYYEDKYSTVTAPNLDQGASYSISVTSNNTSGFRSVWIDFNDDGTFNNSNEWLVQTQYTGSSTTGTYTLSIPSTAPLGNHRMRVLHNYYYWYWYADNPCANGYPYYMYGQVEDYKVKIVTPTIPSCANLSVPSNAASVCYSSVSLAWSPDTTGGTPTGYNLYVGTDYPPTNLYNGNNVGNVTSYALSSLTQNATYYWYVVPYNSIGSPSNCTIYSFTTNGPCYCTSISYSYGCYPISNVSIGTLNNSTSSTSYYENNTTVTPPNLEQGWSYTMSVTNGSTSCMSTTMWIDLNDDGTFATSEALGSINYSCSNPGIFTVNIPSTATLGQHRMRIVSNYAYWQWISDNPCPNGYPYAYGQVEDYTVNITAPQPAACNTLNSPANNAVNVCNNTLSLSWSAPTTGGNITGYYLYLGTDNPPTNLYNQYNLGNVTSFTPTGILGDTTYYWSIVPYNSLGPATGCSVNTFNTLLCYCTSISYSYGVHEITNVTLGTLNNSTYSGSYYENNTSVTAPQLEQGINYSMSITNTSYYHNRTVWIDFNDDGTFATNEQVVSNYYSSSPTSSHTINIPATAPLGQHRMRIVSNYNYWTNSSDNPCPNGYPYAYGQVEDYTIEVITPLPVNCNALNSPPSNANSVCSNAAGLSWYAPTSGGNVQGYYLYMGTDYPPTNIYNQYDLGNVTSFVPSNVTGNAVIYWQIVPYNVLGPATGCAIDSFNTILCYCFPVFSYGTYDINNVTLHTLNYSNTTTSYYEYNASATITQLEQGVTYPMSINSGTSSMTRSVWIDFNDDGVFSNTNERLVSNYYTGGNTLSNHNITIPSTAVIGTHRMRVLQNYYYWQQTADNPCPNGYPYAYGQVEDYNVEVISPDLVQCNTTILPVDGDTSVCAGTFALTWNLPSSGGYPLGYYLYFGTDNPPTNMYNGYDMGNVLTFTPTGVQVGVTYYWSIVPYNSLGAASGCTVQSFSTSPCYCTPTWANSTSSSYYISSVTLNTLSHSSSGNNVYEDFTSYSTCLNAGNSYTLAIGKGYPYGIISMWIDFNDNYIFDANEQMVANQYDYGNYYTSYSFTIPSTVTTGAHRMRILNNYYYNTWTANDPCGGGNPIYYYGQAEDYTLNILGVITAGNDTTVCLGSSWNMNATTSVCANGTWTLQSGNVTIANPSSATTNITVNGAGTNVLRWSIGPVYDEIIITGLNAPTASISAASSVCNTGNPVDLDGQPTGGVFSGPGVVGNTFEPYQLTPNSSYDVTYMYTNSSGCSDTVTHSILVTDGTITTYPYFDDLSSGNCWSEVQITGNASWELSTALLNTGLAPNSGGVYVFHNNSSSDVSRLVSPTFDLTSIVNPVLQFFWSKDNLNNSLSDSIKILISTDGGLTYTNIRNAGRVNNQYTFWQSNSIMLTGYGGQSNVRIAFETKSQGSGIDMGIDQVNVFESDCPEATGLAVSLYNNKATFTWSMQPNVDYAIRYSTTPNGPWTYIPYASSPSTTPTLQPSTTYYWQIRATCNSSVSYGWSTTVQSFTTTNPPQNCVRPFGLSNAYISNTARTVSWSNAVTADSFIVQIWYRTSSTSPWIGPTWKSVVASSTTNLTNLISGTDYRWRVKSMCLFQGSGYSVWNYFNSSVIRSAGFNEPEILPMDVTVYPNPNSGAFTVSIEIGKEEEVSIRLTDLLGHTLYEKQHSIMIGRNLIDMDFSDLSKGVYILRVNDSEDEQILRVTLQ